MADADKCILCGAIIPEGRQVCPNCSKEEPTMRGDYFNSESKANFLIKVIKFIATETGFDIINRIKLRGHKTGCVFK